MTAPDPVTAAFRGQLREAIDRRAEPQSMTLQPGSSYQFRGVFVIEVLHDLPVEIEWRRVVDDPDEKGLAEAARLDDENLRLREQAGDMAEEIERLREDVKTWRATVDELTQDLADRRAAELAPAPVSAAALPVQTADTDEGGAE